MLSSSKFRFQSSKLPCGTEGTISLPACGIDDFLRHANEMAQFADNMTIRHLLSIAVALMLCAGAASAQEKGDAKAQLKSLVGKVNSQLKAGKRTEADLADTLKEFDTLLEQHKGNKSDEVAQILLMKAMLYIQVFKDSEKGVGMLKQIKQDFPDSAQSKKMDEIIPMVEKQAEAQKVQSALKEGGVFPDFDEKDLEGKPLSIAKYKGKVVLVDFWATWCGPCVAELPNVLKAYQKYHDKGFEIIGISLDEDRDALTSFIKKKEMPWKQYFDGKGWQNKLARQYGVNSIPATYLLDGEGKLVKRDLRGEALAEELEKLLAKK